MSKIGRPTDDPCTRYTVFIPKSIDNIVQPINSESKSKRIVNLIKKGIQEESKNGVDPERPTLEDQLQSTTNEVDTID